jgi:hypothetical protein
MNPIREWAIDELRRMVLGALGDHQAAVLLFGLLRPRRAAPAQRHRHCNPAVRRARSHLFAELQAEIAAD